MHENVYGFAVRERPNQRLELRLGLRQTAGQVPEECGHATQVAACRSHSAGMRRI